ncbi:hypothetical protein HU200_043373 [Digitaria exilis]|uniref:Exocyst subunit Exo70 family protein n=1 Tax=Digitaria exilis TaxID=1010633 RepID=A0A835BBD9_9POAL|nr:hypothetical protein HU200_043373 [Digitaria exilis]
MMKQRIGGRWSSRRGEEAVRSRSYSISSSSTISGTLSTAYTSNCSRNSSGYLASAMHFDFELEPAPAWAAKAEEEQIKHIANLVREFSDRGGDARVPERWLTELGIGWVLHLPIPGVAASSAAGELGQTYEEYDAPSWIWALSQIVEIIVLTPLKQLPNNYYEKEEQAAPKFFQKAMLKMLPFVDWIVASSGMNMEPTYENLSTLLAVHGALSKAFPQIQLASDSSLGSSAQVFSRIHNNLVRLLAAKEVKAGDAIWSVMKQIRARILEPTDDNLAPEGSSDIHKATRSVISYIRLLQANNHSSLARVVSVKYLTHNAGVPPLDSMIIEIASSLEENLAKESESFPDCGLRFLFLTNNSYYIWSVIDPVAANSISFLSSEQTHKANTTRKVRDYMESYLQASWAPVLSCLFNNPTPLCLGKNKNNSPLAKFESEFHKTYTTHKLWKVPDPGLRKSLRKAITMKIMPGYTEYIEDNNITTPRIAPQELEEMLHELFEG